ncbi:hypothetical protein N0V83_004011 [Neocucurbitaria cava]|uniref:DNA mismatch repair protein S5 domain-containing protein n=1 Tax=Neocucurbitaria cava TaxID=798079 RepID=A0A9W8YB47_9PLEO|nr:hypothetical protein N0V83_004011 [Neocucurbitaria cava]
MTESAVGALPGIAALPPTTARQIGSGQVLIDPGSVVKELIDNALDARAKSIFVDITTNTIDSIQVRDDGHGIPAEDRALVCRRYCTSKIRDFHDLKDVGGKWLGFRGEALSSMAEMSDTLSVITRVEGEPVAVKLSYGRDGELTSSTGRVSHPVGTTVKVTNLFEHLPVRKQTAIKSSARWLAKIRRLMQAYALARPAIRLRLRVLKAKNEKGDFVYAPKADAKFEDTVLKVIGKDCALQCDWTALETDGFEIHAFLPKSTAIVLKVVNFGAFISIDARPMSNSGKTVKKVVAAVRDALRKSNSLYGGARDPFFCINIICPPQSYDPNIEPAKDDVLFENEGVVIGAVQMLLASYYPVAITDTGDIETPTPAQQPYDHEPEDLPARDQTPMEVYEDAPIGLSQELPQSQPRWRSSMYGIDEDDLDFLQENQPPEIEEEEGLRAAAVSNPWTIARMNAINKPRKSTTIEQLLSPAKSQSEAAFMSSSPAIASTPQKSPQAEPLTPQNLSPKKISPASLDSELRRNIQHLPQPSQEGHLLGLSNGDETMSQNTALSSLLASEAEDSIYVARPGFQHPGLQHASADRFNPILPVTPPPASSAPRRSQRKQQGRSKESLAPRAQMSDESWFGQPMRGSQPSQPTRKQKKVQHQNVPLFASDMPSSPTSPFRTAGESLGNRLCSENNADIRDFLGHNGEGHTRASDRALQGSSFTPINVPFGRASDLAPRSSPFTSINVPSQSNQSRGQRPLFGDRAERCFPRTQQGTSLNSSSRAISAEPQHRSLRVRDQSLLHSDRGTSTEPVDMAAHFRAYAERESSLRANNPRNSPSLGSPDKARRLRRRTTDGLERTKSSKLPLERVPSAYRIQDIVLPFATSLATIVQSSRKLDMGYNSLEWGYPADIACDVFAEPITERKIMHWVIRLDETLHEQFGRMADVDTCCELHEGIQRELDARKEQDGTMDTMEGVIRALTPVPFDNAIRKVADDLSSYPVHQLATQAPRRADDEMSDFDMSQFIDLDAELPGTTSGIVDDGNASVTVSGDSGEEFDDDMLMDL